MLSGILLLAAWLRLRDLGLVEFKTDEALAMRSANDILDGHIRAVGLTSSVGARNPPLFVYLVAIPAAIRNDPLVATAFVGLLAVAAIALTYMVLRPRFGSLTALGAAALFATAPWAVAYGRKIWAQDMLPVFSVSLLWSLFAVLERRRTRAVALVPILLCATFQLNFSAVALVVPAVVVLLYRLRDVHWPAFAAGIAGAVLLISPWLAYEAKHGFEDVSTLVREGRGSGSASLTEGVVEAARQTGRLVAVAGWDYIVGASRQAFEADAGLSWTFGRAAGFAAVALLALGLVTSSVRIVRGARLRRAWPPADLDQDAARRATLLVWLAGIWLAHATSPAGRVLPHYLIVTYPVSFAVQALGLADVTALARGSFRRPAVIGAVAVVTAITASYVAFTVSFHRFLDENGGANGDYGVVYRDKEALAKLVRERGLHVWNGSENEIEYLVSGSLVPPPGATRLVTFAEQLTASAPPACSGERRTFGVIEACFPRR